MAKSRKSVTLASRHLELRTRELDNPLYTEAHHGNDPTIKASVNIRESAIATLAYRGVLNRAQEAAADRFRAHWEALGGAGAGAIDYSREYVDGGQTAQTVTERQLTAGRELKRCREELGAHGFSVVSLICGEGKSLHEICQTRRERETTADILRIHLDALAVMWRLAGRAPAKHAGQAYSASPLVTKSG